MDWKHWRQVLIHKEISMWFISDYSPNKEWYAGTPSCYRQQFNVNNYTSSEHDNHIFNVQEVLKKQLTKSNCQYISFQIHCATNTNVTISLPNSPFIINPLNAKLNPIRHLLALVGAHHILHVSRIRLQLC